MYDAQMFFHSLGFYFLSCLLSIIAGPQLVFILRSDFQIICLHEIQAMKLTQNPINTKDMSSACRVVA